MGVTPGYWKEIERMVERREQELMEDEDFNGIGEEEFDPVAELDMDRVTKMH
jgi:hypothetical protein